MVLAFEPNACIGDHRVNIGDSVLITETGCGGHRVALSGAACLKAQAEPVRVPLNHGLQFMSAQRPEVMHEANARVQLRVSRQPFL